VNGFLLRPAAAPAACHDAAAVEDRYVHQQHANHPDQPIMTYVEFLRERQQARYAVGKGRFRGCC